MPGSPALNASDNTLAAGLTTDQRGTGFNRVIGDAVDIGAYEEQTPNSLLPTVTTVTAPGGTYNGTAFAATVTVTGSGTITGTPGVTYFDNTRSISLGSAAPINAGNYTVTATYAGDATQTGSSDSAIFTIQPKMLDAMASSQGTINIGSNGSIELSLTVSAGQLYGMDTIASLFNGATFTIQIRKADGSVSYGTLTSTARVEADGRIVVSMQMDNTFRTELY